MAKSKIEWTEQTWNPFVGCTKISEGCKNCYAKDMHYRLQRMGVKQYQQPFGQPQFVEHVLEAAYKTKKPTTFFVCSMSDLFHEKHAAKTINKVFEVILNCKQHRFIVLTKRSMRMRDMFREFNMPDNVIAGVTIESKESLIRLHYLKQVKAKTKFLSCEPLLEDLGEIDLTGIDVVIVGGESGKKARQMQKQWVLNLKNRCDTQGVKFFFKQWGGYGEDGVKRSKKLNGCSLDGVIYQPEW